MSFSSRVDQGYLSFAKGLVTEYNPLDPPEGTTSDELNMDLDTDGLVRVRRDPLQALVTESLSGADGTIVYSAVWEDLDRLLVLVKRDDVDTETSDFLIDLLIYKDTGDTFVKDLTLYFQIPQDAYVQPSMTFLRQRALLVLGGEPYLIQRSGESYDIFAINLLVRDFKLLDDGLGVGVRSFSLSNAHRYNLLNAGWYQHRRLKDPSGVGDPIQNFKDKRTLYPSNADISYLGDVTNPDGDLVFDPMSYDNLDFGSTEAPRGHYIYRISNIDRQDRLSNKNFDGSQLSTLQKILEEGEIPEVGPPAPDEPVIPPIVICRPGQDCTIIP